MLPFAVRTGLEPATPGVTGRYSNQLNYRTNLFRLMRFSRTRMQRYAFFLNLQIFLHIFHDFFKKKIKAAAETNRSLPGVQNPKTVFGRVKSHLTSITRFSSSALAFRSLGILTLRTPFSTHASILSFSAFSGNARV